MASLMNQMVTPSHHLFSLFKSCQNILSRDLVVRIEHTYREGKRVVDSLANLAMGFSIGVTTFQHPFDGVFAKVLEDCTGISFSKSEKSLVLYYGL